jgi:hypothetical protein
MTANNELERTCTEEIMPYFGTLSLTFSKRAEEIEEDVGRSPI